MGERREVLRRLHHFLDGHPSGGQQVTLSGNGIRRHRLVGIVESHVDRFAVQRDANLVEAAVVVVLHERDVAGDMSTLTGTFKGPLVRDEQGSERH